MTSPSTSFITTVFDNEMNVTKRNGQLETVSFDKILKRIKTLGQEVDIKLNYTSLVMKVIDQLYDGIPTTKIDELSAEQCASLSSTHPDYNILAGRIVISNHHKNTSNSFTYVMRELYEYLDKQGNSSPLVSDELYSLIKENGEYLDKICDYKRDYLIDYFGFKTLERSYLMKKNRIIIERPQHMWLRVAIGIHGSNMARVKETYELMSQKYFTHATPTLFNSGTPRPQLSSCFLIAMEKDSIDGIYNTLKDCALISKMAGGIGLHIHNIRATGSHIRGTNGISNGIVPMLRVFNNTAKYVDQCLHPETIIYTDEGSTEIKNCVSGKTRVFNKTGGIETIQNVLEHYYKGSILNIEFDSIKKNLQITPEHPIYVIKKGEHLPDWIDAKELIPGDRIISKKPEYEVDISDISEDDCKFYFYLFAYGGIKNGKYYIYVDSLEKEINDFLKTYLRNKIVEYEIENNGGIIIWSPTLNLPFRYSDVYDSNNKKHINSRWLLLPLSKIKIFLTTFLREINNIDEDIRKEIDWLSLRESNIVDISGNILDYSYKTVTSIQESEYDGILYDLQMKNQHDYLLEMGLVHNGGGKRNGSFAIYLEPWHADIEMFLQMRKNHGDEELKARDLFYALWIPDLFMERVKANGKWTLMCPDECPGLSDVYDKEFNQLYESYELSGKGRITINARDLWFKILDAQMETGTPYILFKDSVNKKSNQKNIGIIKSSNLCVAPETLILTDYGEKKIKDLVNSKVNVWNGKEFSEVTVVKTGTNTELIKIYFDNNKFLECTPYHKFYILKDKLPYQNVNSEDWRERLSDMEFDLQNKERSVSMIDAKDLKIGMELEPFNLPNTINTKIVKVKGIMDNGRIDDTYCFKESKRGRGTFNGIVTGQCTEITEYSDENETAVCNLASIGLPSFIYSDNGVFKYDYEKLHEVTKIITYNLNKIIDVNYYPTEKTKKSNMRHRPIGIGVQGLADTFIMMGVPFYSEEAKNINKKIFETIYHGALESSNEMAVLEGEYETFRGSPASQGILQFDLWSVDPGNSRYDWNLLKSNIQMNGLRNSLLIAPMPTASTSQILGFNECIEPITSNIYSRRTNAGDFIQANKFMMLDLIKFDLWNEKIKNNIIANNGSIQQIDIIPEEIKEKYKTVWEIPMRHLIDMAADRGAFICQSQSLNLWLEDPTYNSLTSMHFYSWSKGLKTGIYYLRRRARHQAQQFTIEPENKKVIQQEDDICEMCSS
jgi:ribonucleotide reductase alpha subunit